MKRSYLVGSTRARLIPLTLLLAGYQAAASAASLSAVSDIVAVDATLSPLGFLCRDSSASTSPAQCQGTYDFLTSTLHYNGSASADYGVIKAYGEASISKTGPASGTVELFGVGSGGAAGSVTSGLSPEERPVQPEPSN
jgi:hypothetical protein